MSKKGIWRVVAVLSLVVVLAMVCGCASSKKPKPVNPYKGVMSDRGNVPPAYAQPSGPQSLKAAPATQTSIPAPTDDFDGGETYVAAPEEADGSAEEDDGPVIQDEAAASAPAENGTAAAAAPKQNFPVVANGKVPSADLAGKGGATSKTATTTAATAGGTYVVKSGDILGRIAKAHGVKVNDIISLNPNVNPNKLIVGQKLVMPAGATNLDANAGAADAGKGTAAAGGKSGGTTTKKGREPIPADGMYTVAANDSLWKIGDRFGVSVSDIRTWNGLTSDRLKIGQQLKLRGEGGAAPANTPAPAAATAAKTDGPVEAETKDDGGAVPVEGNAGTATPAVAPAAPVEDNVRTVDYFVCEGDTIDSICNAIEILRSDFLQANPSIRTDADLKVGMPVRIIMRQ